MKSKHCGWGQPTNRRDTPFLSFRPPMARPLKSALDCFDRCPTGPAEKKAPSPVETYIDRFPDPKSPMPQSSCAGDFARAASMPSDPYSALGVPILIQRGLQYDQTGMDGFTEAKAPRLASWRGPRDWLEWRRRNLRRSSWRIRVPRPCRFGRC